MVPGNINESSVYRTLREIARSMKITLRAIDAKTVELTTFQTATSQLELEVYYYGDIIEETLYRRTCHRYCDANLVSRIQLQSRNSHGFCAAAQMHRRRCASIAAKAT